MIKAVIETQSDNFGSQSNFELFNMKGVKILEFETYEYPVKQKFLTKDVICYDDFFVVDSCLKDEYCGFDIHFFRAYDYDSKLILSKREQWTRGESYKAVRNQQKYNMLIQNEDEIV